MHKKLLNSSLIAISGSVIDKTIGIVSTAIVARVLSPSDFGLIAIAIFFYELCSSLGDLGTQKYILRSKVLTNIILNQTFTFRFISLNLQALLLLLLSGPIANILNSEHLEDVLYFYSLALFIKSFQNIYFFKLYHDFNYKTIIKVDILVKIISSVFGIIFALVLKNFLALVYAQLLSTVLLVLRTYLITNDRPKFDFTGLQINWSFSKWILLETLIGYIRAKFDTTLTASFYNISTVGRYDVARSNGQLPLQTISEPLSPILLSKFSGSESNSDYNDSYLKMVNIISIILSPMYIFLYFNMDYFILFFLGDQWTDSITLFQLFLTMSYFSIYNSVISNYFISKGKLSFYTALNLFLTIPYLTLLFFYARTTPTIELFTFARVCFVPLALFASMLSLKILYKAPFLISIFRIIPYLIIATICYLSLIFFGLHSATLLSRLCCAILFFSSYFVLVLIFCYLTKNKLIFDIILKKK